MQQAAGDGIQGHRERLDNGCETPKAVDPSGEPTMLRKHLRPGAPLSGHLGATAVPAPARWAGAQCLGGYFW